MQAGSLVGVFFFFSFPSASAHSGMSSLLAILLVTQADQSSPSLVFAWPPRPTPTLRLDRPVYRPEQSRICGGDLSFYAGKKFAPDRRGQQLDPPASGGPASDGDDDDSAPARLFYAQPPPPPPPPHFHGDGDPLDGHHPPGSSAPTASSSPSSSTIRLSYLGFEPDAWADMLTPRIQGCSTPWDAPPPPVGVGVKGGGKLELVIDALAIVAHPALVNQKLAEVNLEIRSMERGRTRTRSGEPKITSTAAAPPTIPPHSSSSPPIPLPSQSSTHHHHHQIMDVNTLGVELQSDDHQPKPTTTTLVAPISQLTRMMTPSSSKSFHHPGSQTILQLQSSPSIRTESSNSSTAPLKPPPINPKTRYTYSPMVGFPTTTTTTTTSSTHNTTNTTTATAVHDEPHLHLPPHSSSTLPYPLAPLQSFTLALVIDTPPASHLTQHLQVYYKDVVLKLTAALKHLERKSSYLTREVQGIMTQLTDRRHSHHLNHSNQPNNQVAIEDTMKFLQENCDLPRALARAFNDLKTLGSSSITLDQQLDLDLLLHRELLAELDSQTHHYNNWLHPNPLPPPTLETLQAGGEQDRFTHLESWKSLLLLQDEQLLVEQTAPGSLLRDFIKIIKPALTLSEYKFLLDTDSNTIADMTNHLLYWRKAMITDMMSLRNSYQLTSPPHHPLSNTDSSSNKLPISTLQQDFSTAFPNLPNLVIILSLLSQRSQHPFSSILPLLNPTLDKSESMAVLVWLLKRNLVVRERTHVRIKIGRSTKLRVALLEQQENKKHGQKGSDDENYAIDERDSSLSPESQPRDRDASSSSHQAHKQASLLDKTVEPPQPHMAHHPFTSSSAKPSSLPHGWEPRASSHRGSLQPRSISSAVISETHGHHQRSQQQSVQSYFSPSSYRLPHWRHQPQPQPQQPQQQQQQQQSNGELDALLRPRLDLSDSIIGEPGQATALEQKWIDEICTHRSDLHLRSFNSAFRYFNGRYPLEEIMARAALSRRALNDLLAEFQDHLVLLVHP